MLAGATGARVKLRSRNFANVKSTFLLTSNKKVMVRFVGHDLYDRRQVIEGGICTCIQAEIPGSVGQ